jgi:hypothetical protein
VNTTTDNPRTLIAVVCAAAVLAPAMVQAQDRLDPSDPEDALAINRKIQCSTVDNEPVIYSWSGQAFARRQGERDTYLFDVEGMNIRACSTIEDPERGKGYALVSREILLYLDKETGEPLSTWDNPWTGETVDVLHVANDPVNFENYVTTRSGGVNRWAGSIHGDQWTYRVTVPLYYPNPLGGRYQAEVGGVYHATEMFNFFGRTEALLDPETSSVDAAVGWARMSDWLPWMKMSGRDGIFWVHSNGVKLDSFQDLPEVMKTQIREHYPNYDAPPPAGDDRENMTSWKYYKGVQEGTIEPPDRSE